KHLRIPDRYGRTRFPRTRPQLELVQCGLAAARADCYAAVRSGTTRLRPRRPVEELSHDDPRRVRHLNEVKSPWVATARMVNPLTAVPVDYDKAACDDKCSFPIRSDVKAWLH